MRQLQPVSRYTFMVLEGMNDTNGASWDYRNTKDGADILSRQLERNGFFFRIILERD